jgi:glycosyltransferase involved in cell wall biosynthesis
MSALISVAHIITKLELGGAQQNTLFTVSHLNRARFRPILITGEPGLLDREARAMSGLKWYQVPSLIRPIRPFSDLHALVTLTKLLAHIQPHIVHTHSSKAGILGRCAARLARVPIVIHSIHGFGFTPNQHPLTRHMLVVLERRIARLTTRFFAVSEANRRAGISLGIFRAQDCSVIRSGVDLKALRRTRILVSVKKREMGLNLKASVIGMIAALKPQKAPLDFVRVAALVRQQHPHVEFVLIGDGELRSVVEHEVDRCGLSTIFHIFGWRHDIAEILRCIDIFMLTSRWEGLPRVYLEALASGLPVVGTRVDGASEVIRDGINGFLCDPGDVGGLAERAMFLLRHPDEAKRMGHNAESISSEFDIYEMVLRQEREYERLMAQQHRNALKQQRVHASAAHV